MGAWNGWIQRDEPELRHVSVPGRCSLRIMSYYKKYFNLPIYLMCALISWIPKVYTLQSSVQVSKVLHDQGNIGCFWRESTIVFVARDIVRNVLFDFDSDWLYSGTHTMSGGRTRPRWKCSLNGKSRWLLNGLFKRHDACFSEHRTDTPCRFPQALKAKGIPLRDCVRSCSSLWKEKQRNSSIQAMAV